MLTHGERLERWAEQAHRELGLIDVDFYPGSLRETDMEAAAEAALTLLQGTSLDEDVTELNL